MEVVRHLGFPNFEIHIRQSPTLGLCIVADSPSVRCQLTSYSVYMYISIGWKSHSVAFMVKSAVGLSELS